ncbi:uncharacterized protein LOC115312625 [Ixodes scapularis]|uniref:uncharacterized protein LOC115312625 n=1 Tax=Ixodes scapularis TaxID=6945 RepID=UPI001C38DC44|nr:uncharacterized protein LOC115312625 [Ixodes scapularis]
MPFRASNTISLTQQVVQLNRRNKWSLLPYARKCSETRRVKCSAGWKAAIGFVSWITKMGVFVTQSILLASFVWVVGADDPQFIFNLTETVRRYADYYAKLHKTTFWFYDLWAERDVMKERGVYKSYKLSVTATNFQFGEAIGKHIQPKEVFTTTITNHQETSDLTQTVSQTHVNTETAIVKLVKGFEANYKTSVTVGVPLVISAGVEYSFDYSLSKTKLETKTKTETLGINVQVRVPPQKTVQVTWYVSNTVMDFPWTATVIVRGWFAIWVDKKVNNHNLHFFPVSVLTSIDGNLTRIDLLTVSFEAEGVFRKVATHDSRVFTYELKRSDRATPTTTRRRKAFITPPPLE